METKRQGKYGDTGIEDYNDFLRFKFMKTADERRYEIENKDYPIFRTDIMGAAEGLLLGANFSDFAGRNHAHETVLEIKSGNFEKSISFPIQMNIKKGMPIQLYLIEDKIKKFFCDEAIYEF